MEFAPTAEVIGEVACVFKDGVNVEHWDGELWAFYKWSEVPNAAAIKAAWRALAPAEHAS